MNEPHPNFTIARTLDAPRALVYKAWSEPERLAQWWGPQGFELIVLKLDFRPGGVFHYCMRGTGCPDMYGRFDYLEIVPGARIAYLSGFADAEGQLIRAPFPGMDTWPLLMHNVLTLDEADGKTLLHLSVQAHEASAAEQDTFFAGHLSMQGGFGGTLAKLDGYLAKEQA
ncbi:MAG TPA: SRPBCC domain-containing protein [Burkholderiaceae bacterium]